MEVKMTMATPVSSQRQRSSEPSTMNRKRRKLRRKRSSKFVHLRGGSIAMDTIPEERASIRTPQSAPLLLIPLLLMAASVALNIGSPAEWKVDILRRNSRALMTLTPEHVDQYPFNNFLDVGEETPKGMKNITGFYWQVPRAGGTTLKHIMGTCLRKVQAARTSSDYCDMNSNELSRCQTKLGTFVNADPSDHGGIRRSEKLKLVPSGLADVIVSSRILHAATLYDEKYKGRLFTILRDPIERAVSTFYYLQSADWERNYRPEFKKMNLIEYAALPDTANNWMCRWLTGKNSEPELTRDDLAFAKELLRRKFLILLTDEMSSSVQRLLHYLQWSVEPKYFNETKQCLHDNISKEQGHNKVKHPTPKLGTPEYEALRNINLLDLELYEYAKELFVEQWAVVYKGTGNKLNELFLEDYEEEQEQNPKDETPASSQEAPPVGRGEADSTALEGSKALSQPPVDRTMPAKDEPTKQPGEWGKKTTTATARATEPPPKAAASGEGSVPLSKVAGPSEGGATLSKAATISEGSVSQSNATAGPFTMKVQLKDNITSSSLPLASRTPKEGDNNDAEHDGDTPGTFAVPDAGDSPETASTATATKGKDVPASPREGSAIPKVAVATAASSIQRYEPFKDASVHDAVWKPNKQATSLPEETSTKTASSTLEPQWHPDVAPEQSAAAPEATSPPVLQDEEKTSIAVVRRAEEDGANGTA